MVGVSYDFMHFRHRILLILLSWAVCPALSPAAGDLSLTHFIKYFELVSWRKISKQLTIWLINDTDFAI